MKTIAAPRHGAPPVLPLPADSRPAVSVVSAAYGLLVLIIATVLAAVNRQILILLADPMRHALALSDTKLGLLQGVGITLFAGLAAVPIGWLADRYGRRLLLALCVLVWTGATAACGFAVDFQSLLLATIGLGLGEAGLAPIVYGMLPDIVPERRRVMANGIYALAAILGAGLGIALSGRLIASLQGLRPLLPAALQGLDDWRLAFVVVGAPGPLVSLLILLVRVRPAGSVADSDSAASRVGVAAYLRANLRTVVGLFGGTGLAQLGLAALANWVPVVVARSFGASAVQIGQGIGGAYLAGTVAGAAFGALTVRKLGRRLGVATPMRVLAIGLAVGAIAALLMLAAHSALQIYLLFALQVASMIAGSVLVPTLLQDMTPAALRSRVIAVGTLVAVGLSSLSPVLVGLLSDALQPMPQALLVAAAAVSAASLALGSVLMKSAEAAFVRTVQRYHPELADADQTTR